MGRWVRISTDMLHDYQVQRLQPPEFREAFMAGLSGHGPFARHIRTGVDRLSPTLWRPLRVEVFRRDGFRCAYCGATPPALLECDHIVPLSRGGSNDLDNLTTACRACNRAKGARRLQEWRQ